ncbi:MAG TPA: hypothetical protein VFF67_04765 [Thermoplasmata archaeon]|nr:hypothetical protein [Thermoplasmata archaeon]
MSHERRVPFGRAVQPASLAYDRRAKTASVIGSVGSIMVVIVLTSIPWTAGAHLPTVSVPPFRHTNVTFAPLRTSVGHCHNVTAVASNHWLPRTGNLTTYAGALALSCGGNATAPGIAVAFTISSISVGIPVTLPSGHHNVSVTVAYSLTITASLLGTFHCPSAPRVKGQPSLRTCMALAQGLTGWDMRLYDATNATYLSGLYYSATVIGPTNWTYISNTSHCNRAGTCGWYNRSYGCATASALAYFDCQPAAVRVTGNNTSWINTGANCAYASGGRCTVGGGNWSLNSSHRYRVIVEFAIYAVAYTYGYLRGGTAVGSVNAATFGNLGWKIQSITVR